MEIQRNPILNLPPGFRFHPSDEELIVHYLRNKASSTPLPTNVIAEVELYKLDPWELPNRALFGDEEWYFFTPRDRKYPNGVRPNRMAASGYWKATGTDKPIFSSIGAKIIGVKKALVFYNGRPPKGNKSEWIMDEYRLLETMVWTPKKKGSMRLDDWVLCRVRQKGNSGTGFRADNLSSTNVNPNLEIVSDSLFKSCPLLPFIIDSELSFPGLGIAFSGITNLSNEEYSTGENTVPSLKRQHVEKIQGESFFMTTKRFKSRDNEAEEVLPFSNDNMNMSLSANQWKPELQFYELDNMAFA